MGLGGSVSRLNVSILALDTVSAALRLLGQQGRERRGKRLLTCASLPQETYGDIWSCGAGSRPGSTTHGCMGGRQRPRLSLVHL